MNRFSRHIFSVLILLSLVSCYSAQQIRDRRIVDNQDVFDTFNPEVREMVRHGNIDIGFNEAMVRIAWGPPSRVFNRTTKDGETLLWEYTRTQTIYHPHSMGFPVHVIGRDGRSHTVYHGVWFDYENKIEYTTARVEFSQGVVTAVERLRQ